MAGAREDRVEHPWRLDESVSWTWLVEEIRHLGSRVWAWGVSQEKKYLKYCNTVIQCHTDE